MTFHMLAEQEIELKASFQPTQLELFSISIKIYCEDQNTSKVCKPLLEAECIL